jgi:hypothetical protein
VSLKFTGFLQWIMKKKSETTKQISVPIADLVVIPDELEPLINITEDQLRRADLSKLRGNATICCVLDPGWKLKITRRDHRLTAKLTQTVNIKSFAHRRLRDLWCEVARSSGKDLQNKLGLSNCQNIASCFVSITRRFRSRFSGAEILHAITVAQIEWLTATRAEFHRLCANPITHHD